MDRRRYLKLRRWMPLFAALRLLAWGAVVYLAWMGANYVLHRSRLEVEALQARPKPDVYLGADAVRMSVIDNRGNLSMEITGSSVTLSSDQRKATFKDAEAKYFEHGAVSLEISAGQIEYDTQTEDFHLTRGDAATALRITTRDGWTVDSEEVEWRQFKEDAVTSRGQRPPSFRFPQGVNISSRDGNLITASYMQADHSLNYMEFVGNFKGNIRSLDDTQFITERDLTRVEDLKLKDIENIDVAAEQVIYDKRSQVVLATSRFYDRAFQIRDFDGNIVRPEKYQPEPQQVLFRKTEATILADHIEAHIASKWAESFGNITMIVPPSEIKASDDKALREMRQFETRIVAGDIEYFWGKDHVITHDRTIVQQEDRRAEADRITYWGAQKMVLLDGGVLLAQGSGDWLTDAELINVKDQDQSRMLRGYTEVFSDKAVVYLNNNDFIASGGVQARQDNRETSADTIVYQDEIKRLTAKGNVKFRDIDGQTFLGNALIYHNESEYMQVEGGSIASIRLPARFANDINRTIAESRERPVPPEIVDPEIPDEPRRNPNTGSEIGLPASMPDVRIASSGPGLGIPGAPPAIALPGGGVGPAFIPDDPDDARPERRPGEMKELFLQLGGGERENTISESDPRQRPSPGGEDGVNAAEVAE